MRFFGARDRLLERFQLTADSIVKSVPIEFGAPEKGQIRYLLTGECNLQDALLSAYDRTLNEWNAFFRTQYAYALTIPALSLPIYKYMETMYMKNMRLRWIAKKWMNIVRSRIAYRRLVGAQDLYTLQSIPNDACVQIVDYASKSVYMFHYQTAHRSYLAALLYSSYGIPSPQLPKNPYTNLAWTYGQSIELCRQVCRIFSERHGFANPMLCSYMLSNYNIKQFTQINLDHLRINAAESLFRNVNDPESKEIYDETLDGLFELGIGKETVGWSAVRAQIVLRALPDYLMKRWDTLILAAWIHETYGMPYKHLTNVAVMSWAWASLFKESYEWWNASPKTILRRD